MPRQIPSELRNWFWAQKRNPLAALSAGGRFSAVEADGDRGIDYSTYLGGTGGDVVYAIAARDDGALYIAGGTESLDFPSDGSVPRHKGSDGFVLLLAPDGQQILRSVVVGGSGNLDQVEALYLSGGTLYVAGFTNSSDFPTTADAVQPEYQGDGDGFLLKMAADDLAVIYSTYIGGSGGDAITGAAANATGEVFLTGVTSSLDFAVGGCRIDGDAFVVKLDRFLSSAEYRLCVGGSGEDSSRGLALDNVRGSVVLGGVTESTDFPIKRALQPQFAGGQTDAFLAVIDQQSGNIRSATYWGGSEGDQAFGVAVDGSGAAYLVGSSYSGDFPVTDGLGGAPGEFRGFVSKFLFGNGDLQFLGYSRLLGGIAPSFFGTAAYDVAVDAEGNPVVVGTTNSPDFPIQHAPQPGYAGFGDTFVTVLSSQSGEVEFSTFLGGSLIDTPNAVATAGDAIYVAGVTDSIDFPAVRPFQGRPYGGDAFVTHIVSDSVPNVCLYVTGGSEMSVTVLDTARRRVVGLLGNDMLAPNTSAIAVAPGGGVAYVLELDPPLRPVNVTQGVVTGAVAVVDTNTGELKKRFGALMRAQDLFVSQNGEYVYVVDGTGLTAFDPNHGEPLAIVPISQASRASMDWSTGSAYILGDNGSHVYVVDLSGPNIIHDFALGPGSLAIDVAFASKDEQLLVAESLQSQLVAREPVSGDVLWDVPIGPGARSVVISPDEDLAFVSHGYLGIGAVTVVDRLAHRVVALLSFESGVDDLAVTPDGAFLYITSAGEEQVWVADMKTLQIIGKVPIGRPAEKVALGTSWNGCRVEVPCDGDCNGDGEVKIDELIAAVGILLGTADRSVCASLGNNDPVTIDYLVGAVRSSLEGCPAAEASSVVNLSANGTS